MAVNSSLLQGAGLTLAGLGTASQVFVSDVCKAALIAKDITKMDEVCPPWTSTNAGLVWIIVAGGVVALVIGLISKPDQAVDLISKASDASKIFRKDDG